MMRTRRAEPAARAVRALLMTMFVAAACTSPGATEDPGGSEAPPPSVAMASQDPAAGQDGGGSTAEVCDLLDPAEIEGIVGNPVDAGSGMSSLNCTWGAEPEETSISLIVLFAAADQCQAALSADEAQRPVDNQGVAAYWSWIGVQGGVGTLSLCTASEMLSVTVSFGLDDVADGETALAQATELAALAAPRR